MSREDDVQRVAQQVVDAALTKLDELEGQPVFRQGLQTFELAVETFRSEVATRCRWQRWMAGSAEPTP